MAVTRDENIRNKSREIRNKRNERFQSPEHIEARKERERKKNAPGLASTSNANGKFDASKIVAGTPRKAYDWARTKKDTVFDDAYTGYVTEKYKDMYENAVNNPQALSALDWIQKATFKNQGRSTVESTNLLSTEDPMSYLKRGTGKAGDAVANTILSAFKENDGKSQYYQWQKDSENEVNSYVNNFRNGNPTREDFDDAYEYIKSEIEIANESGNEPYARMMGELLDKVVDAGVDMNYKTAVNHKLNKATETLNSPKSEGQIMPDAAEQANEARLAEINRLLNSGAVEGEEASALLEEQAKLMDMEKNIQSSYEQRVNTEDSTMRRAQSEAEKYSRRLELIDQYDQVMEGNDTQENIELAKTVYDNIPDYTVFGRAKPGQAHGDAQTASVMQYIKDPSGVLTAISDAQHLDGSRLKDDVYTGNNDITSIECALFMTDAQRVAVAKAYEQGGIQAAQETFDLFKEHSLMDKRAEAIEELTQKAYDEAKTYNILDVPVIGSVLDFIDWYGVLDNGISPKRILGEIATVPFKFAGDMISGISALGNPDYNPSDVSNDLLNTVSAYRGGSYKDAAQVDEAFMQREDVAPWVKNVINFLTAGKGLATASLDTGYNAGDNLFRGLVTMGMQSIGVPQGIAEVLNMSDMAVGSFANSLYENYDKYQSDEWTYDEYMTHAFADGLNEVLQETLFDDFEWNFDVRNVKTWRDAGEFIVKSGLDELLEETMGASILDIGFDEIISDYYGSDNEIQKTIDDYVKNGKYSESEAMVMALVEAWICNPVVAGGSGFVSGVLLSGGTGFSQAFHQSAMAKKVGGDISEKGPVNTNQVLNYGLENGSKSAEKLNAALGKAGIDLTGYDAEAARMAADMQAESEKTNEDTEETEATEPVETEETAEEEEPIEIEEEERRDQTEEEIFDDEYAAGQTAVDETSEAYANAQDELEAMENELEEMQQNPDNAPTMDESGSYDLSGVATAITELRDRIAQQVQKVEQLRQNMLLAIDDYQRMRKETGARNIQAVDNERAAAEEAKQTMAEAPQATKAEETEEAPAEEKTGKYTDEQRQKAVDTIKSTADKLNEFFKKGKNRALLGRVYLDALETLGADVKNAAGPEARRKIERALGDHSTKSEVVMDSLVNIATGTADQNDIDIVVTDLIRDEYFGNDNMLTRVVMENIQNQVGDFVRTGSGSTYSAKAQQSMQAYADMRDNAVYTVGGKNVSSIVSAKRDRMSGDVQATVNGSETDTSGITGFTMDGGNVAATVDVGGSVESVSEANINIGDDGHNKILHRAMSFNDAGTANALYFGYMGSIMDANDYDDTWYKMYNMYRNGASRDRVNTYFNKQIAPVYGSKDITELIGKDAMKAAEKEGKRAQRSWDNKGRNWVKKDTAYTGGLKKDANGTVTHNGKALDNVQIGRMKIVEAYYAAKGVNLVWTASKTNAAGVHVGKNGSFVGGSGNTITIDVFSGLNKAYRDATDNTILSTAGHEGTHWLQSWLSAEDYLELSGAVMDIMLTTPDKMDDAMKNYYKALSESTEGWDEMSEAEKYDRAFDEAIANSCAEMLQDDLKAQVFAEEHTSLFKKIMDAVSKFINDIKSLLTDRGTTESKLVKRMDADYKRLTDIYWKAVDKASENAIAHMVTDPSLVEVQTPMTEAQNSLERDRELMDIATAINDAVGLVDADVLNAARDVRTAIREYMQDPDNAKKLDLPPDIEGTTFVEDSSYGGTMENMLICPRSLAAQELLDKVGELLERPLTVADTVVVSKELENIIGNEEEKVECFYCYVAQDRRAYRELFGEYLNQRDTAMKAIKGYAAKSAEYNAAFDLYGKGKANPRNATKKTRFKNWHYIQENGIEMLSGKDVANLSVMNGNMDALMNDVIDYVRDKFDVGDHDMKLTFNNKTGQYEIRYDVPGNKANKEAGIYNKTITNLSSLFTKGEHSDIRTEAALAWQYLDIIGYSQSGSKGKKISGYNAYNGEIARFTKDRVAGLNSHYGLRMYSFSDFSPAYILENMQMVTDASVKGLKALAYTKAIDFARIFRNTDMNINISCFGGENGKGNFEQNNRMGAPWAQTKVLRKDNPNIGVVMVATSDDMVTWAMSQDWIDVVIPFHLVFTGADVARAYNMKNYAGIQGDRKLENAAYYKKNKVPVSVSPTEHNNDLIQYVNKLEEYHLGPRFEKFLNGYGEYMASDRGEAAQKKFREANPYYMKLVNETRRSYGDTPSVKPVFDEETAIESLKRMEGDGGFYGYRKYSTDENAKAIADKIRGGATDEVNALISDAREREAAEKKAAKKAPQEQFMIRDLPDGRKYVEEDRTVIYGNDPSKWPGQLTNYINKSIRKNEDVVVYGADGSPLWITRDTTGKATFRNVIQEKSGPRLMTDEEYEQKLQIEGHIDEIAQVSFGNGKIKPDGKNHHFAKDGFTYRTAYWKDASGYYKVTLSVGRNGTIDTIYNVGRIEEARFPSAAQRPNGNRAHNPIVPQNPKTVKKQNMERDQEYMSAVDAGDMETAQRMVDEAAKAAGYDSPKLFHGTRQFGFTEIDMAASDDGISFFAAADPRTAKSYSGPTTRNRINQRSKRMSLYDMGPGEFIRHIRETMFPNADYASFEEVKRSQIDPRIDNLAYSGDTLGTMYWGEKDQNFVAIGKEVSAAIADMTDAAQNADVEAFQKSIEDFNNAWQKIHVQYPETEALYQNEYNSFRGDYMDIEDALTNTWISIDPQSESYFKPYISKSKLISEIGDAEGTGVYELYANTDNMLVVDNEGRRWNEIKGHIIGSSDRYVKTRDVSRWAKDNGYSGVIFKNIYDYGVYAADVGITGEDDVYVFFDPNALKSADPATYDESGNVIPISERFNRDNRDIRYMERDQDYMDAVESGDMETAQSIVDQAAFDAGYVSAKEFTGSAGKMYHGSNVNDITEFNTNASNSKSSIYQLLFGTHLTLNPDFAEMYTHKTKGSKGTSRTSNKTNGRIYELYAKLGRTLDLNGMFGSEGEEAWNAWEALPEKDRKWYLRKYSLPVMEGKQYVNGNAIEAVLEHMGPAAAREWIMDQGYNSVRYLARYNNNGYQVGDVSYIVLDPSQVKSADPVTYDNDGNIIPPSQRFNDQKNDIRFSMRDEVEEGDKLIAVHNITEENLLKSIKNGGFPSPSIAVTKRNVGNKGYGWVSVLFKKDSIDPSSDNYAGNVIYGDDAWTDVYPRKEDYPWVDFSNPIDVLGVIEYNRTEAEDHIRKDGAFNQLSDINTKRYSDLESAGNDRDRIGNNHERTGIDKARVIFEELYAMNPGVSKENVNKASYDVLKDYSIAAGYTSRSDMEQYGTYDASGLANAFYENGIQVTEEWAERATKALDEMYNNDVHYFEAKPRRVVGLDEIAAIIVPNNINDELRSAISDAGIEMVEYEAPSEYGMWDEKIQQNRIDAVNAAADEFDDNGHIMFMEREEGLTDQNLLRMAKEAVAETETEREYMKRYKEATKVMADTYSNLEGERYKVGLYTAAGKTQMAEEARNNIKTMEKELESAMVLAAELEESKPLVGVMARIRRETEAAVAEALANVRDMAGSGTGDVDVDAALKKQARKYQTEIAILRDRLKVQQDKMAKEAAEAGKGKRRRNLAPDTKKLLDNYEKQIKKLQTRLDAVQNGSAAKVAREIQKRDTAMRNMRERRMASETRQKIRRIIDDFNKRLAHPRQGQYIPAEMVRGIINALESFDLSYMRAGEEVVAKKIRDMYDVYDRYKKDGEYTYYNAQIAGRLEQLVEDMGETKFRNMKAEQLDKVYESMKGLHKVITEAIQLKAMKGFKDAIEAGDKAIAQVKASDPLVKGKMGEILNWMSSPDNFFKRISGFAKNSVLSQMQHEIVNGEQKMLEIQREYVNLFADATKTEDFEKLSAHKNDDLIDVGLVDMEQNADGEHEPIMLTRGMMLSLYMHLDCKDNIEGIARGGIKVPNIKRYYEKNPGAAYDDMKAMRTAGIKQVTGDLYGQYKAAGMSDEQIQKEITSDTRALEEGEVAKLLRLKERIWDMMTEAEKDMINSAHEWFNNISRAYINEVSMDLVGYKLAAVENYFPIMRDSNFLNTQFASVVNDASLQNMGFLKERVKASQPILLQDFAYVMAQSVDHTSRYVGFARAERDFNLLYRAQLPGMSTSLREQIGRKFGSGDVKMGVTGMQYIENYVNGIIGNNRSKATIWDDIRSNLARSTLTLNPRVALSQAASIPTAVAELDIQSVMAALKDVGVAFNRSEKDKLSQDDIWFWQRYRGQGGMTEFADAKKNGTKLDQVYNKINDSWFGQHFMNWCQDFDVGSTAIIHKATENWVTRHTGYATGSEEWKQAVADKYRDVLRRTQPMYMTTARSDLMRSNDSIMKTFTMFKTQASQNLNTLYNASAEFRKFKQDLQNGENGVTSEDVVQARGRFQNSIAAVAMGAVAYAFFRFLVNALMGKMRKYKDDDTDKVTMMSTVKGIGLEALSSLSSMVVFGDAVWSAGEAILGGGNYYGISETAVGQLSSLAESSIDLIQNWGTSKTSKKLDTFISDLAGVAGIPYDNMKNAVNAASMYINGLTTGMYESSITRTDNTMYNRAISAMIEGNDKAYDDVMAEEMKMSGKSTKEAQAGLKNRISAWYEAGALTKEEATKLLTGDKLGLNEDDVWWLLDKADYKKKNGNTEGYDKTQRMQDALLSGNADKINEAMTYYKQHGYSGKIESAVKAATKALYEDDKIDWDTAEQILINMGGFTKTDKKKGTYVDEDGLFWEQQEWDWNKAGNATLSESSYSKFTELDYALDKMDRTAADEQIEYLMNHGVSKSSMATHLKSVFKDTYMELLDADPKAAEEYLTNVILPAYIKAGYKESYERKFIATKWI